MALSIKTTLSASKDGTTITLSDTTGAFDAMNNTGGYGALQLPLGTRDYTDIIYSFIRVYIPSQTDPIFIYIPQATAQAVANYGVGKQNYDITGTIIQNSSGVIPDGLYRIEYDPCFDVSEVVQNINKTNGSNELSYVTDDSAFTNLGYVLFPNDGSVTANGDNHYLVDSVDTTNNKIILDRPYQGTTGVVSSADLVWGYNAVSYIAITNAITSCLSQKIAKLSCKPCSCGADQTLWYNWMLSFGIQANFNCGNYDKVQDLIDCITNYCTRTGGGCGCH